MKPLLIFILISTFTPGPNNILSSTTSSKTGVIKTLPFMIGVLVGTFIVFVVTGYFNILFINNISNIETYIGYIGAIYMSYLAFNILRSTDNFQSESKIASKNLFFLAIFMTFVNPKAILFGLTVSGLYFESSITLTFLLLFSLFLAVLCFVSVLVWGIFGFLFMKFLSDYHKVFNIVMASLLLYSALIILIDTV